MKLRVALDAGHAFSNVSPGEFDPGIVSGGKREADVALAWALTGKEILEKEFGIDVILTRSSNTDPTPINSRAYRAIRARCTHFLSLHTNGANIFVRGTETLYKSDYKDRSWAFMVQQAAMGAIKSRSRGIKRQDTVLRYSSYYRRIAPLSLAVLNQFTTGPACLLETAFLSNPADRARVSSKEVRIAFFRALGTALTKR